MIGLKEESRSKGRLFYCNHYVKHVMLYSMAKAKSKLNSEHITLLVTKATLKAVSARCADLSVTRSQYLRDLVVKDLEVAK